MEAKASGRLVPRNEGVMHKELSRWLSARWGRQVDVVVEKASCHMPAWEEDGLWFVGKPYSSYEENDGTEVWGAVSFDLTQQDAQLLNYDVDSNVHVVINSTKWPEGPYFTIRRSERFPQ